ncbi:hypothetical protein CFBP4996_15350 [Agrobacterium leguminum]|nr:MULTISPECIES: hypothetical protein [Agrobacterium]WFS67403.1 hypothetical protein CFBP4996_15350 [Agrobacterium leguminum]
MVMTTIPLPAWLPDMASLNSPGLAMAYNVYPLPGNGGPGTVTYAPVPSAQKYSDSTLPEVINSACIGTDRFSSPHVYAATATKLWTYLSSARQWSDVSKAGDYISSATETWNWIQYGTSVIGTSFVNAPQWISCDDVTAKFADLTTVVRGRHIAQHKGFVLLANCYDSFDGEVPNRLRWSAIDNPFDWSFSQATMADFQDLQDVGAIQGMVVDEDLWIFCKQAIIRGQFVGSPWVYEFSEAVSGRGLAYPNSLITIDGVSYFLDDDGFYSFKKGQIDPIGVGKINLTFYKNFDTNSAAQMTVVADPRRTIIKWNYADKASPNGLPNKTIIYNYVSRDWTICDSQVPYEFQAQSLAWTIEDLSNAYGAIENIPAPFDSPLWAGGNAILWAVNEAGNILTLTGPPIRGTIETTDYQLGTTLKNPVDMALVQRVRPIVEGDGRATVSIAGRRTQKGDINFENEFETNASTGFAYVRAACRYHRFKINLYGAWDLASAIDVDFVGFGGR